jgi:hypothetical protein
VQWKVEQQGYAMHKLVHAWGHDQLAAEEQSRYSQAAFGLVVEAVEAVGEHGRGPEDKLRLVPYVMGSFQALASATDRASGVTEDVIDEIEGVGGFVTDLGRWPEAQAVEEYVLQARSRLLGEEHPSTILSMSNLANTLGDQGQLDEAAAMMREVLEKRRRILGEEHPRTKVAIQNLAILARRQKGHGVADHLASKKKTQLLRFFRKKSKK